MDPKRSCFPSSWLPSRGSSYLLLFLASSKRLLSVRGEQSSLSLIKELLSSISIFSHRESKSSNCRFFHLSSKIRVLWPTVKFIWTYELISEQASHIRWKSLCSFGESLFINTALRTSCFSSCSPRVFIISK